MANVKYCSSCGKPNPMTNGKMPEKCMACDKPLGVAFIPKASEVASVKTVTKIKKKYVQVADEDDEIEEDAEFDGEIIIPKKFEVEVSIAKKMTVRDLAQGGQISSLDSGLPDIPTD